MGFTSFRCAKSNESIPSPYTEPCEVTLFLSNGKKISGVYDGYGSIGHHNEIIQSILFETEGYDIRLLGGKEEPESAHSKNSIYTFIVDVIDRKGNVHEMEDTCIVQRNLSVADLFKQVKDRILKSLAFDLNKEQLKLVKNKYVEDSDTFESLRASPDCSYQGHFYPEDYDWNVPHQYQQDADDTFESDNLDSEQSASPAP